MNCMLKNYHESWKSITDIFSWKLKISDWFLSSEIQGRRTGKTPDSLIQITCDITHIMKHGEFYLCGSHKNPLRPRYNMKDIKLFIDYNVCYYGNTPVVTSAGPCTHYISTINQIYKWNIFTSVHSLWLPTDNREYKTKHTYARVGSKTWKGNPKRSETYGSKSRKWNPCMGVNHNSVILYVRIKRREDKYMIRCHINQILLMANNKFNVNTRFYWCRYLFI